MACAGQSHQKTQKCGCLKIQSGKAKPAEGQTTISNAPGESDQANPNHKARKKNRIKILYPNEKF